MQHVGNFVNPNVTFPETRKLNGVLREFSCFSSLSLSLSVSSVQVSPSRVRFGDFPVLV